MTPHRILKTFKGSQTGNDFDEFLEGTERPLSDDLALIAVTEGWAEPVKAPRAEDRQTKVNGPEETKVEQPEETKADAFDEPAAEEPAHEEPAAEEAAGEETRADKPSKKLSRKG